MAGENIGAKAVNEAPPVAVVPQVAVVVPTYNEQRNIARLLRSIRSQSVPSEIIVVDQESRDETLEIARRYGCAIITCPAPAFYTPPGARRNRGAAATSARTLLHVDADMELPTADFLGMMLGVMDDAHRAVVIHEQDVASGFWGKCKALERRCYWDTPIEAARAVRRDLFDAVGGYDGQISSGEDFHIASLYGRATEVTKVDGLVILHHTGRQSLVSLLKKKYRYGKTASLFLRKSSESGARQAAAVHIVTMSLRAYLRNLGYLGRDPIHYLGIFPLRMLEFLAVRIGMLSSAAQRS